MSEISEKIRNFVVENFLFGNANGLTDDSSFLDDGIIDSTGVLELITYIENTFMIKIDDEELIPENLDSIKSVESFLQGKLR